MKKSLVTLSLLLTFILSNSLFAAWDFGVAWIEREEKYPNPKDADGAANRPAPGDLLNWTAHFYCNSSSGTGSSTACIKWYVNTVELASHTQTFERVNGRYYQDRFQWRVPSNYTYDFTKPLTNTLKVAMLLLNGSDARPSNDAKQIYLDAMTFLVKVSTNTFYKYTTPGSKSFYDYLEESIQFSEGRYAAMSYPLAPYGIIDRYRVDRIVLMNENSDPTKFWGNENYYTTLAYSEGDSYGGYLGNPYDWIGQTFFYNNNGVFSNMGLGAACHETGHSLCFPDTYRFNMSAEKNKVFNRAYTCNWADPPGKEDIMRYCYNGTKDVFTELACCAINLHAGEQRRYPPEMHNGKAGWMFAWLPTNILVRVYGKNGRELDGLPIKFYRGTGNAYEMAFENTTPAITLTYHDGAKITPAYSYDNNNLYYNSFIIEIPGNDYRRFNVIDSLRLNYAYIKGGAETATFSFTNTSWTAAEPTSVTLGDGSGKTDKSTLKIKTEYPSNATKIRWAYSLEGLKNAFWQDIQPEINIMLDRTGDLKIYVQTLSSDNIMSAPVMREISYNNEVDYDFGLAWLERTPKYGIGKYDIGSTYRPEPGDHLTWTANIYCNTDQTNDAQQIIVDWYVNTKHEATHTNSFPVLRGLYTDDFQWTMPDSYVYDFTKPLTNIITATLRYVDGYSDLNPSNDVLNIHMDALTFGVTVVKDTFDKYTRKKKSFYDYMNDTLNYMNAQYARAKSVIAPYGIIDRYRVGYLRHQTGQNFNINDPYSTNCTTQLVFNEGGSLGAFFNAPYYWIGQTFSSGIFDMAGHGALCHETGHSMQLPDTYRFDLSPENNAVNGQRYGCNWMDPPGMQDIMRFCYDGWDDCFCGPGPFAANLQAGVYRKTPPELYSNAYCNSVGWMFEYLPTNIVIKVFNVDGRELDSIPITMHRGSAGGYYMHFDDSTHEWWRQYTKGGLTFEPNFRYDNDKIFENCFLLTFRCTGLPWTVLDQLRINYLCMTQSSTNSIVFSYTNNFAVAEITGLTLNDGAAETTSTNVTLALKVSSSTRKARWAFSEEELENTEWGDTFTSKEITLPEEEGTYTVYAQVLSRSFVPSYVKSAQITLVPEPVSFLLFLLTAVMLRKKEKSTK